jgi:hypothetical protein
MASITSLNNLLAFVPQSDKEREILNLIQFTVLNEYLEDTKSTWAKGKFYLGGFIKMSPDEEITLEKIEEIKIIRDKRNAEYGGPCNSWEAASIYRSERQLSEIEKIVKKYIEIYKMRVADELLKIKSLNNDVTGSIVKFI